MELIEGLLFKSLLYINNKPHRLLELEFYYFSPEHPDTFTHGNEIQYEYGKWYFHRAGKTKQNAYKGQTWKGLDISIGNGTNYGGILIRGLQQLDTGEIIKGPCRCVNHILHLCNYESIDELVTKGMKEDLNITNPLLYIKMEEAPVNIKITAKKRIGLTLKRPDEYKPLFIDKLYNFSTYK